MKKITYTALLFVSALSMMMSFVSCNDYETYADKKKKEKNAIERFLTDNDVCGPIKVISETQFRTQDSTTNVENNEYVLFEEDGIYMQIINRGAGKTFPEMSKEYADSTVNKVVLCRFLEYNIMTGDTTNTNYGIYTGYVDYVNKMVVKYSHLSRSYSGTFTSGASIERDSYSSSASVPKGWLKPLNYIRLSRSLEDVAHVRVIVPHNSGTNYASGQVEPYYYDITYQLGL